MPEPPPPADPMDSAGLVDPIDPDVDLTVGSQRQQDARPQAPVIAVIAAGGVIGACARYGATLIWTTSPTGFPWTTLAINVTGCALMGVLMVLITERLTAHRLVRPFAGTGILGGYTTFSTYAVDIQRLLTHSEAGLALAYLIATVVAAVGALWATTVGTRAVLGGSRRALARGPRS